MTARIAGLLLLGLVYGAIGSLAFAEEPAAHLQRLMASPGALEKGRQAGKKATFFCANCHGETGNAAYGHIPNLAGQNPVYLLDQLQKFADGRRRSRSMSSLVKMIKTEDLANIAVYYAGQPVLSVSPPQPALVAKGRQLYGLSCRACHGDNGYGTEKLARLAGQRPSYILESIRHYQEGRKERVDLVMTNIARRLSGEDAAALANYIVTMK